MSLLPLLRRNVGRFHTPQRGLLIPNKEKNSFGCTGLEMEASTWYIQLVICVFSQVLRFSRLFGPGKHSSLPHMWRSVKKRRKKKKSQNQQKDSDSGSDSDIQRPKRGWTFNYAPRPTSPSKFESDDEVILLNFHIIRCKLPFLHNLPNFSHLV